MAKKRFDGLNTAEQLTAAVDNIVLLVPDEKGAKAVEELRRASNSAVKLLLEQSEHEFQNTIRTVKTQAKCRQTAEVHPESIPNTASGDSGTHHSSLRQ